MEQLVWGLQITVAGMGLVFSLLALLWGLLTLVLRFDTAPAAAAEAGPGSVAGAAGEVELADAGAVPAPETEIDADLLAAITVAVVTHRAARRREAAPAMRSYWPGSLLYASRWVATGRARQNYGWRRRGR
jgi:glutaconyl-CoA/methylmalonyl-CoA decarboxylase subunit delta